MLIDKTMRHVVAFLTQETDEGIEPMASAFFVSVNINNLFLATYVVTARHNLEFANAKKKPLHLRINTDQKRYEDLELNPKDWIQHWSSDVAVAPFKLPVGVICTYVPSGMLLRKEQIMRKKPEEGAQICMPALFSSYYGKQIMYPITRTGRIALIPEEKLPAEVGPNQREEVEGYLIETLSWGGCSGAPVFVDYLDTSATSFDPYEVGRVRLLGLISSHFDVQREVKSDADTKFNLPLNGGIALVVPAQAIVDILMLPDIVEMREKEYSEFVCPWPQAIKAP